MVSAKTHPLAEEYELLREWEGHWRPALERVQRAFEVDASAEDLARVARALGRVLSPYLGISDVPRFDRWPACTVMVTAGAATESYREGAFWDDLWAFLGLPPAHRRTQEAWGDEFLRSLRVIGLQQASDGGTARGTKKYVTSVLLHAGVPTYCLDDLFDLLLTWRHQFPTASTDSFLDWVDGARSRLDSLDSPARTFLRESREQAMDVLERCVLLLDRLTANPSDAGAWSDAGLAERFQRPALQALVRHQNRDHQPTAQTSEPHLHFVSGKKEVQLILPPGWSASPGSASWLRPSSKNSSPNTVVLARFVRQIHLVGPESPESTSMPLHAEGDELLVFTRQGRAVPLNHDVLPQTLWLLHPRDSLVLSAGATLLQREDLTDSWYHWQASWVDLPPGSWFRSGPGPVHRVARASAPPPEVLFPDPLPGVVDLWKQPVHAQRPRVSLSSSEGPPWTVQVFAWNATTTSPLTEHVLSKGSAVDPLAPLPRPQVGSFTLRAQRPGEKLHEWHFSLAEGVSVSHKLRLRFFDESGIEPSWSRVTLPHKLTGPDGTLKYGSQTLGRPVRVRGPYGDLSFIVGVPQLEMALSEEQHWSSRAFNLTPEHLRECGDLLFRGSDGENILGNASLQLVSPDGDILQREQPRSYRGDTLAFPLARFNEAAQAHHEVTVELQLDDRTCQVVRVRPTPLATEAVFGEDDRIQLHCAQAGEQLIAALYQEHAPWRSPAVLRVQDGQISTEEHFSIGGPVRVLLRVDDPWAASPDFPAWPGPADGTVLECDMPGRPNSRDREEDLLCTYLSGRKTPVGPGTLLSEANTARVWTALTNMGTAVPRDVRERFSVLLKEIARSPGSALSDYTAAASSPVSAVWALILCGAASTLPEAHPGEGELTALWERNPVAAVLLSRNAIRMTPPDASGSTVPEAVMRRCGSAAEPLLSGLPRPLAPQAPGERTGAPPTKRELADALRCSPGSRIDFLDPAAEQLAVERAARLDTSLIGALAEQGADVFSRVHGMCARQDTRSAKVLTQLLAHRSRLCPEPARKLPALSLALAVNARMKARPEPPTDSTHLDTRYRTLWSDLARALPELAAVDIVLAELTLTGLERAQLH
ncbi:hypothetical protein ACOALZ_18860 [Nocardiopsis algeriensis]|uniref:hypothetical protein n=1 Tax=Nocardiopsis algeriensis TaxID=1478215 RepID=UPI003B42C1AD